jgi:ascorbate PTS system EIIB component
MKVVAVCGFGVGSSLLLKMSIDKAFKLLGYDIEAENTDLTTARSITCDAIFTSVDLADEFRSTRKVPVYAIKRYMSVDEVKVALEEFIEYYKNNHK